MYTGLAHFPDIDTTRINQIRKKFAPTFDLIDPHITIMYPVPDEVKQETLVQHIERVLKPWRPFPIHISGLCKSWDHWLFLTLKEGNGDVIRLNKAVYTGILKPYHRADIEFVPHIGLGLFIKEGADYDHKNPQRLEFDEQRYQTALREAEASGLDYRCVLDRLHLCTVTNDFTRIEKSRVFYLGEKSVRGLPTAK